MYRATVDKQACNSEIDRRERGGERSAKPLNYSAGLTRSKASGSKGASARGTFKNPVLLSRFRNVGGGRVVQQEHLGPENEHSPPPESGRTDATVSDIIVNGDERAARGSRQEFDGVPIIVTMGAWKNESDM